MLDKELRQRNLCGIRTSRSGPIITHVMYADDIILFSKASKNDATTINHILNKYCLWSGQQVNREKSGILFSKHTQSNTRRSLKSILHMRSIKKDTTYLGAPLLLSRAPARDFSYLHSKLEAKLTGWRTKCLSWAGRRTLICSVAQSIPNYSMSTFSIPKKVCDNLDSLSRRFWWNPKKLEGHFLAWRAWDKHCYPKSQGGLGFKKAKDFNNALFAKLAWMIASKRDNLCMNILRAKYKVSRDWLHSEPPKRASPI